jgi:cysteine synthase A
MSTSSPTSAQLLVYGAAAASASALLVACLAFDAHSRLLAWLAPGAAARPAGGAACSQRSQQPLQGYSGLIGGTPLIRLASLSAATGCEVYGKAEFLNPGGSGKDRVALRCVVAAEASGALGPGGVLIEGTSGSTGISLALLARARGYQCRIFMPNDQAREKAALLRRLGAEVVETPPVAIVHPDHYVNQARRAAAAAAAAGQPALFVDQFDTPLNALAHYEGTGPELWAQLPPRPPPHHHHSHSRLDAFVMGAGTGGTVAGCARYLKQASAGHTQVHLVDPPGSVLLHLVNSGVAWAPQAAERTLRRHRCDTLVEGVGLDRVTANVAGALPFIDRAHGVSDAEAVAMARRLLREEGLFLGSSSAINCVGVLRVAAALGPGHTIATVLCDGGARHLSRFWCDERVAQVAAQTGDEALARALAESQK